MRLSSEWTRPESESKFVGLLCGILKLYSVRLRCLLISSSALVYISVLRVFSPRRVRWLNTLSCRCLTKVGIIGIAACPLSWNKLSIRSSMKRLDVLLFGSRLPVWALRCKRTTVIIIFQRLFSLQTRNRGRLWRLFPRSSTFDRGFIYCQWSNQAFKVINPRLFELRHGKVVAYRRIRTDLRICLRGRCEPSSLLNRSGEVISSCV